jgi:GTP-binding protein HflX
MVKPLANSESNQATQKTVLVALETQTGDWRESLEELALLAETAGAEVVGVVTQKRPHPDSVHFVGRGKTSEVREAVAVNGADLVVVDGELTPAQQRNLENATQVGVVDRTGLILDIFAQRAHSNEGKLQVELAQLTYMLPRLTGRGTELSRLGGGIGTRGPGETKLEIDRRRVRRRINLLHKEVEQIRKHRSVQRRSREQAHLPLIGLVGYTNAGKSTLLNVLTGAQVLVENRLFATLDPTVRRLDLPGGQAALLSDTVGFLRRLPHQLVAAFRATLEEVGQADLLIHVVDASHPEMEAQREAAARVLAELGCADKPTIVAFNKIDAAMNREDVARRAAREPYAVLISATRGEGLEELRRLMQLVLEQRLVEVKVTLPLDRAELVALARQRGRVLVEEYGTESIELEARVPSEVAERLNSSSLARAAED